LRQCVRDGLAVERTIDNLVAEIARLTLRAEEFDGDIVEGDADGGGYVGEAAFGVADLAIDQLWMGFGFALHRVDDVGRAETYVDVVEVVAVQQAALVGGNNHAKNVDVGILEDFVVIGFLREGDGGGRLGVQGKGYEKKRGA